MCGPGESLPPETAAEGADQVLLSALEAVRTALALWHELEPVTSDEFHRHEDRYDLDSRQGRELLFLIANYEWVRGTSEIVNIDRADSIETALKIDVDLSQITHEAFRGRTGSLWLPVTVLPLETGGDRHELDPFATVTDAADNLLPLMPADDLRHQMSAGMAEIIINMAIAHLPGRTREYPRAGPGNGRAESLRSATRDDRILLSAAIHRLLRRVSDPATKAADSEQISEQFRCFVRSLPGILVKPSPDVARFRINRARYQLQRLLASYITYLGQYAKIPEAETAAANLRLRESQFAPKLAYRAVRVLQALAASTVIVVPLSFDSAPTVLTVRVPTRPLKLVSPRAVPWKRKTWLISPSAHLQIDVLLPTADADRQVRVHLADGISFDEPTPGRPVRSIAAARVDIAVENPSPVQDLSVAMQEVLRKRNPQWPFALTQSLADLAQAKAVLVGDVLEHYEVRAGNDTASSSQDGQQLTDQRRESLRTLRTELSSVTGNNDEKNDARLAELCSAWKRSGLNQLKLFRRTSVEVVGPRALVSRVRMIEDVAERATPPRGSTKRRRASRRPRVLLDHQDLRPDEPDRHDRDFRRATLLALHQPEIVGFFVASRGPGDCPDLVRDDPGRPHRKARALDAARRAVRQRHGDAGGIHASPGSARGRPRLPADRAG
jgi:hypothetical protein